MINANYSIRKLFIGGLSNNCATDSLYNYFQKYGEIIDCVIITDKITSTVNFLSTYLDRSRGFGFICFNENFKVDDVLNSQPHYIDGKKVECKIAIPKEHITITNSLPEKNNINLVNNNEDDKDESIINRKLFVGGLHPMLKECDMLKYFQKYGEVQQCVIIQDKPTGKSRGFGFVVFANSQVVDTIMLDTKHFINGKLVDCKRAMPKDAIRKESRYSSGSTRLSSDGMDINVTKSTDTSTTEKDDNTCTFITDDTTSYSKKNFLNHQAVSDVSTYNQNYIVNNYYINQPIQVLSEEKNSGYGYLYYNEEMRKSKRNYPYTDNFSKFNNGFNYIPNISQSNFYYLNNDIIHNSRQTNFLPKRNFYQRENENLNSNNQNIIQIDDLKYNNKHVNNASKEENVNKDKPFCNNNKNKIISNFSPQGQVLFNTNISNCNKETSTSTSNGIALSKTSVTDPNSKHNNNLYNYFYYKLFDFNGEDLNKFCCLNSYENTGKIELFKENKEEKEKYNKLKMKEHELDQNNFNTLLHDIRNADIENCFGPHKNKKLSNLEKNFRPY